MAKLADQFKNQEIQNAFLAKWKADRQLARTDLRYLCANLLGYKDVMTLEPEHLKVFDHLQKFKGGTDKTNAIIAPGMQFPKGDEYKPECDFWELEGPRQNLILISRSHLKSTICTISHTIQWIINYPDISILLSTATGEQAKKFIGEISDHFRINEKFRFLFPEFCPPDRKAKDWGSQEGFTVDCRRVPRKEPTLSACTAGKVVAGGHWPVIKDDDLVDKENVKTPMQIADITAHFRYLWPLLQSSPKKDGKESRRGWRDVIGTRYDYSDAYGTEVLDKPEAERSHWNILVLPCVKNGKLLDDPDAEALWPYKWDIPILKQERQNMGVELFTAQYMLDPIPAEEGLVKSRDDIMWVPEPVMQQLIPMLRLHLTIDLHGMDPNPKSSDTDYTAMVLAGFGRDGRPYIVDIFHGRPDHFAVIEQIFAYYRKYPRILDIKIQEDHFSRTLLPFFRRECEKRGVFPPVHSSLRSNQTSKKQFIKGLQPWFRNKDIRFSEAIRCKEHLLMEIMRFPKYKHDDILDAMADQLLNRDGELNYDVVPRPHMPDTVGKLPPQVAPQFLGFDENGEPRYAGIAPLGMVPDSRDPRTGW